MISPLRYLRRILGLPIRILTGLTKWLKMCVHKHRLSLHAYRTTHKSTNLKVFWISYHQKIMANLRKIENKTIFAGCLKTVEIP